ncbi:hypothetical protein SRABI84_03370 [Peribacillus simplex]|uniref:hypothetical protein n=1 Tax=Peribacillus simplex TaxID=1478 RepID=UPI001E0C022F|nr:hypothetical protein [Peribacillus simplex]CAH0261276.1 hypothetical protein SRABI84_03370 [Peribacillus simplex]
MILKPELANCVNRKWKAKTHPDTTEPTEWFSQSYLPADYYGLTFDFFVCWGEGNNISNEFWIKRTVDKTAFDYWPNKDKNTLQNALEQSEGKDFLERFGAFSASQNIKAKYQLFHDSLKWSDYPAAIITAEVDHSGEVCDTQKNKIEYIKSEIQRLSGGEVFVGDKKLTYAQTMLECHLTNDDTGAAWPGDVDLLLFNENKQPIAIIEFKKNTFKPGEEKHRPIKDEKLSNYYRSGKAAEDNRKYNRLAILRDFINPELPFINLYYPTWVSPNPAENVIKLEKVTGNVGALQAIDVKYEPVPYNQADKEKVIETLLKMIK